jgi:hypothetical protein
MEPQPPHGVGESVVVSASDAFPGACIYAVEKPSDVPGSDHSRGKSAASQAASGMFTSCMCIDSAADDGDLGFVRRLPS